MTEHTQNAPQEDNKLIAERRAKLSDLREQGNAFPNDFRRDASAAELQAKYGDKTKEELAEMAVQVAVAGRMMLDRKAFKVVQDMTGRIQIYASKDIQKDTKHWDLGDIVGVRGILCKSGKGDLYVTMDEYVLLTKSLRPLPEKHKGLTDTEARYRQRYVDLMVNEDSRRVFFARSKIINTMRQYFTDRDFMEVETPMLQVIPGGATARPFVTTTTRWAWTCICALPRSCFLSAWWSAASSVCLKSTGISATKGSPPGTIRNSPWWSSIRPTRITTT